MNTSEIIAGIDSEIERLQQARSLLANAATTESSTPKRGPDRPMGSVTKPVPVKGKRVMSAEGKARIAAAQKKRWAAKRRAA